MVPVSLLSVALASALVLVLASALVLALAWVLALALSLGDTVECQHAASVSVTASVSGTTITGDHS